ncbi:MAG: ADP-ribosylglycohydrolase family protein [Clostridia bacterium]|nr:ADP-ribosylglycohydrolase family protein [Clostridia bacterium]
MDNYVEKVKSVIFGHAVADALGVPVEFASRGELDNAPVTDMEGFGTYPYPEGCWSDDTSMALAALDSLASNKIDYEDIMIKFGAWYFNDQYTPTGEMFDAGNTCVSAIQNYFGRHMPALNCGLSDERSNGNGSLMRIHPFVLFAFAKQMPFEQTVELVHSASALTHAHERSKIGCGIYACILMHLLNKADKSVVRKALQQAEAYYADHSEIKHYSNLFRQDFDKTERSQIKSDGYVVDTLEAAIWCLLTTDNYKDCVLKAVNLGDDTDTVAAVAGGLAGALYGYNEIPKGWLLVLKRREYIGRLCERAVFAWQ